jgi:hypothetical protein
MIDWVGRGAWGPRRRCGHVQRPNWSCGQPSWRLLPVHTVQAFLQCFGDSDKYVKRNNRGSNGLRNQGISRGWSPKPGHSTVVRHAPRMALQGSRSGWGGVLCPLIKWRWGHAENLCFRFSGTNFLNVRNTKPIRGNREIPRRLKWRSPQNRFVERLPTHQPCEHRLRT